MELTKPNKQVVDAKKQDAHRNHQRTNSVEYGVFRKSADEKKLLKQLKKQARISDNPSKLIFQF